MDEIKCKALKADLAALPDPRIVSAERFFDGNDDMGSIGCNLPDHPGIDVFRDLLTGLSRRPDVVAVYARISELDPGDGSWPFTDTIFVVGSISRVDLLDFLSPLEPDEVGSGEDFGIPPHIRERHEEPVSAAWWD